MVLGPMMGNAIATTVLMNQFMSVQVDNLSLKPMSTMANAIVKIPVTMKLN
jgi:hypothetical protein